MTFPNPRMRSDRPQLNSPVLDRRHWPRRESPFAEAALTWTDRQSEFRIEARVVNLSRGGAGLIVPAAPPEDAILRLIFGGVVIDGWAVATRDDPDTGWFFLHMKFSEGCPASVLDRMLADSGEK